MLKQSIPFLTLFLLIGISFIIPSFQAEQIDRTQVLVEEENIVVPYKEYDDGILDVKKPGYKEQYHALNLFDNRLPNANDTTTIWSRHGDTGFTMDFKTALPKAICSGEIFVHNPQNTDFTFKIGNKIVHGKLDSTVQSFTFENCAEDIKQIKFDVKAKDKYTTISEIKLYNEKRIPPIEPPLCKPGEIWDEEKQQCIKVEGPIGNGTIITNSNITLNVSNSTVTINADKSSEVITNNTNNNDNNDDVEEGDNDN